MKSNSGLSIPKVLIAVCIACTVAFFAVKYTLSHRVKVVTNIPSILNATPDDLAVLAGKEIRRDRDKSGSNEFRIFKNPDTILNISISEKRVAIVVVHLNKGFKELNAVLTSVGIPTDIGPPNDPLGAPVWSKVRIGGKVVDLFVYRQSKGNEDWDGVTVQTVDRSRL